MKKLINLFIPAVLTTIAVAAFAPGCGEPVDPGKESLRIRLSSIPIMQPRSICVMNI